ncbi:MAG: TolC family protein [Spirochaetia bacterium]|jgi:outer membrane protein TolC|nr:TolC family protein [Spirochaetia bacterium]
MKRETAFFILLKLMFLAAQPLFTDNGTVIFDMQQAIDTALKNNREFSITGEEISIAEKNLKLKYRDFLPEINLGYSQYSSVSYWNPDSRQKKISAALKQKIYDKGLLSSSFKFLKKETALKKLKITQQLEDFIFRVINSYIELARIRMEIEISSSALENGYFHLDLAKKERELGEITELDLLEIKIAVNEMEENLQKLHLEEKRFGFSFSRLLDLPAGLYPELSGKINSEYNGFIDQNYDYYLENSKVRSSTLKELILSREKAETEYTLASRKNLPDISAESSFFTAGEEFPLTEHGFSISLSLSFSTPGIPTSITGSAGSENKNERSRSLAANTALFGGLDNYYLKESAEAALRRREYELNLFILNNEFDISELFSEIEAGIMELGLLRRKEKASERKAEIEKLQLSLGEIKRIDFMETGIALAKEKIKILDSISSLYRMEISLLRICGIKNIRSTAGFIIN